MNNKELIERYPFLLPRNRWTGETVKDYDYSYTELDAMPYGWRKAFGERMCEEICTALIEADYLDKYRISQIKEKYGILRWYDFGAPQSVHDIISKYEYISQFICMICGNPYARLINNNGWLYTICENCASEEFDISRLDWVDATDSFEQIKKSVIIEEFGGEKRIREIPIWDTWCEILEDYLSDKYKEE